MRLRNNNFAAAFDEMKRRGIVKTQKEFAHKMGVSEDIITRILKDRTEVTEDAITKLQTASGCILVPQASSLWPHIVCARLPATLPT